MPRSKVELLFWWGCLFLAPLLLAAVFHPAGFTHAPVATPPAGQPFSFVRAVNYPGPVWWLVLHAVQIPLIGLMAVGLWLMVRDIESSGGRGIAPLAWLARAATFVMLISVIALEAIGGVALGRSILVTQDLAAAGTLASDQLKGAVIFLNALWFDPWIGSQGSVLSQVASWATFAAALLTAVALYVGKRAPVLPLIILVGFGWEVQAYQAALSGPIGFVLLMIAAAWIWFRGGRPAARFY